MTKASDELEARASKIAEIQKLLECSYVHAEWVLDNKDPINEAQGVPQSQSFVGSRGSQLNQGISTDQCSQTDAGKNGKEDLLRVSKSNQGYEASVSNVALTMLSSLFKGK